MPYKQNTYTVYILENFHKGVYIDWTANLFDRMKRHRKELSSRGKNPDQLKLVRNFQFINFADAAHFARELKALTSIQKRKLIEKDDLGLGF